MPKKPITPINSTTELSPNRIYKLALTGEQISAAIHALKTMELATRETLKEVVVPNVRMARQSQLQAYDSAINAITGQVDMQP